MIMDGYSPRWGINENMQEPNTTEETKALRSLCKAKGLYDVQKWIEAGKSLEIASAKYKRTLLQIAVEIGFHSLVELIAQHEGSHPSRDGSPSRCGFNSPV